MTERIYKCISEVYIGGVPQGMHGECMNLRNWLMKTGKYDHLYEEISDRALVEYMKEYRGKYLIEVE
mgnify:CR=1 FL=1